MNRAAALSAAGVRHDAEGAAHVAALHDRDECRRLAHLGQVVANRVLRAFFFGDVTDRAACQREGGIVHPRLQALFQDGVHVLENAVIFLRADDQVQMRQFRKQLLAAGLGHAAHEAIDDMRTPAVFGPQHAHFSEGFLLRLIAHRAGVDQNGVGLGLVGGHRVTAFDEHPHDLFGVALIHLAAVGSDVDLGHEKKS